MQSVILIVDFLLCFRKVRKTKAALKADPVSAENALLKKQNADLTQQVNLLNESVAALQASLRASRNESVETESVEFNPTTCPSSTQAGLPNRTSHNGLFVRNPAHMSSGEEPVPEVTRWMSSVTVGSITITECKPSDGEQIGRRDFENWMDLLTAHLKLAGVEDESTKLSIFKIKAGSTLLDIYHHTKSSPDAPDAESFPFANAVHRLKMYFKSSSDVMLQRRRLALLAQQSNEADMAYVARAAKVARQCNFDESKELEEIVGTIAGNGRSKELRVVAMSLLRELNDVKDWNEFNDVKKRELTYQDLIDRVRGLEAINLNETHYRAKHNGNEQATVAAVAVNEGFRPMRQAQARNSRPQGSLRDERYNRFQPYRRPGRMERSGDRRPERFAGPGENRGSVNFRPTGNVRGYGNREPETTGDTGRCYRCHSVYHKPENCTAKDKNCVKCGRMGHYARACPPTYPRVDNRGENSVRVNEVSDLPALMDVDQAGEEEAKLKVGEI